ncbi:DNA-directed RNA polymerase specialized sigma24 family protein/CheY-like chemotaxis protein [Loktanella ponticola]|uniref:DNA-directed RNA polymerase specialized sigma24 family protein/CheY-like chemotaxis protein n=1 Tax=Yoonia ponticola TaxID=1524255 RepID=A0A7W9EZQ9_9RHOB|nr:response regulator [Yoonia ponticola]MBB5723984.1 DNA-directed RNA polymerase specialized sigma24 family protein/CheY-like chemotaxis protein [Yoonia ponticola]
MNDTMDDANFSDLLAVELPYLRRYTRALTGSQSRGDNYTVATLETILKDRSPFDNEHPIKVNLFKCFHAVWTTTGQRFADPETGLRSRAHGLLANLTANSREALLLRTVEEFSLSNIATIMQTDVEEVRGLIKAANSELADSFKGRVMIIEDEPIIAADLSEIVSALGHQVTGVARTHKEALTLGAELDADLILADIQLADNSSGIDAVNDLLELMDVPVIFITAFPERLLTGDRPEPAFLISKPFQEAQVQSAVSQAMFFASTETLKT